MDGQDKIFALLDGVPLIIHTLAALNACPDIDTIVVAARPEDVVPLGRLCRQYDIDKIRSVVCGGQTRPLSVLGGLIALPSRAELAAVHDAVRPFATAELISAVVSRAAKTGAAAPAVYPKDTVKLVTDERIERTVDRDTVMLIQTPQVFNTGLLKGALTRAIREGWEITDDCGAVERLGMLVSVVEGAYGNFKVTTPEDLIIAKALMEKSHENRTRV